MRLGTIIQGDQCYYDDTKNPLIMKGANQSGRLERETVAPFGRPVDQELYHNTEYATPEAAQIFADVLHDYGCTGVAPNDSEKATFVTMDAPGHPVQKLELVFPSKSMDGFERRVNAGVIATILGDDPDYGITPQVKSGFLATALGEEYDRPVHIALTKSLMAAVAHLQLI